MNKYKCQRCGETAESPNRKHDCEKCGERLPDRDKILCDSCGKFLQECCPYCEREDEIRAYQAGGM